MLRNQMAAYDLILMYCKLKHLVSKYMDTFAHLTLPLIPFHQQTLALLAMSKAKLNQPNLNKANPSYFKWT